MPSIIGIEQLDDGLRITLASGRTVVVTSATIPAGVKSGNIAGVQTWLNNWLIGQRGGDSFCVVRSVTPLIVSMYVSDQPIPPGLKAFAGG